jgi:chemotaxis protein histidine kinase CheA
MRPDDAELAHVFLEEASAHLTVLADAARARAARLEAARGLATAAGLVGQDAIREHAEAAARALAAGDEAGVAAQVAVARAQLDAAAPAVESVGGELFAPAELGELMAGFREEAAEHLDALQAALRLYEKEPRRPLLDEILRKAHTLKGSASMLGLGGVAEAAHALEGVLVLLRGGELGPAAYARLHDGTDELRALVAAGADPAATARAAALRAELDALRHGAARPSAPPPASSPSAAPGAEPLDDTSAGRRRDDQSVVLRVDPTRLDHLMDAVGELVFDRTRIERRVGELRSFLRELGRARSGVRALLRQQRLPRLAELENEMASQVAHLTRVGSALLEDTEALRRTTRMLQDGLTQVRMMKVRWLFQRVARPVRDFERLEGKRVHIATSGGDTELDKAVVERVTDPLLQLLRNAVAHGIEPASTRLLLGKPAEGQITLAARHQGESVFLEVSDDGAGIDTQRVRASLVASGRMTAAAAAAAPDEEIVATLFEPGVSTRADADELAGRGVGLDVVRETVASLGGAIAVTSTPGLGAKFSLRLPLTTAIGQAYLFKVAGQVYAVPNAHVLATDFGTGAARERWSYGGQEVPLVHLARLLGVEAAVAPAPGGQPLIMLEFAGRRLAVTCDKLIGPREIVVKSLGPLLAPLRLYAGATISGAGKVQLILDPAALVQVAYPQAHEPAVTSASVAVAPVSSSNLDPRAAEARPRVLVADDSRTVRDALARTLGAAGYVVDVASDGLEAWDMLHEARYQALVTDLEMPRLGGSALVERVRRDPELGRLPVLAISSRSEGLPGADAFLPKPVPQRTLVQEVARLLGR